MNALGEMLPWEVEGQDIIDGATVGMFDAGADKDPEESRATFLGLCWPNPTHGSQAKGLPEQSAAVGGAVRGPPEGDDEGYSQVRFDTGKGTASALPEFVDAGAVPATATRVRAQRLPVATRKASKKPRVKQGAASPIKRSRPSRIWVCQEPECVYTSGRKGAEHSPHRGTPLSSRDLLEVERVSDPVCARSHRPTPAPPRAIAGNFERHMRNTHTLERPHKCPECDYASGDPGAVKRHMRQHTGECPAVCTFPGCAYAAKDYSNLGRHIRVHTGERPFSCPEPGCEYIAAQSGSIRSHVKRRHRSERAYACDECDYTAKTAPDLKKHIERGHDTRAKKKFT